MASREVWKIVYVYKAKLKPQHTHIHIYTHVYTHTYVQRHDKDLRGFHGKKKIITIKIFYLFNYMCYQHSKINQPDSLFLLFHLGMKILQYSNTSEKYSFWASDLWLIGILNWKDLEVNVLVYDMHTYIALMQFYYQKSRAQCQQDFFCTPRLKKKKVCTRICLACPRIWIVYCQIHTPKIMHLKWSLLWVCTRTQLGRQAFYIFTLQWPTVSQIWWVGSRMWPYWFGKCVHVSHFIAGSAHTKDTS